MGPSSTSRCLSHSVKSHARLASRRECTRTEARARHQSVHTHRPREAAAGSRAAQPGGSVRLGGAGGCGARRHGAATARALSPVSTAHLSHETERHVARARGLWRFIARAPQARRIPYQQRAQRPKILTHGAFQAVSCAPRASSDGQYASCSQAGVAARAVLRGSGAGDAVLSWRRTW